MKLILNTRGLMIALLTLTIFSSKLSATFMRGKTLQQSQDSQQPDQLMLAVGERLRELDPDILLDRDDPIRKKAVNDSYLALMALMAPQLGAPGIKKPTKEQVELLIRMIAKYPGKDPNDRYQEYSWMIQNGYGNQKGDKYFMDRYHALTELIVSQLGAPGIKEPTKGQVELLIRMIEKYPNEAENIDIKYQQYGWMIQNGYGGQNGDEYFYDAEVLDIEKNPVEVLDIEKNLVADKDQVKFDLFDNWKHERNYDNPATQGKILEGIDSDASKLILKSNNKFSGTYRFSCLKTKHNFPIGGLVVFKDMRVSDQEGLVELVGAKLVPEVRRK